MHEDERISKFLPLVQSLYGAARENLGFKPHAKICIVKSGKNMQNPLGKTAYYSPTEHKIGLYTQGRHIKDILRSLAHELVHHNQNCRGDFEHSGETTAGYAQEDGHLREMEREAYEQGNLIFRDWEDNLKDKGGKPLFTSTSQYVPGPTGDVVGMPLLEENQMNENVNKDTTLQEKAPAKKQQKKGEFKRTRDYRALQRIKEYPDGEKAVVAMQAIRKELAAGVLQNPASCKQYNEKVRKWAKQYKIKEQDAKPFLANCGGTAATEDEYTPGQHTWTAIKRATRAFQENQKTKTTNLLFEGDKMNKKLKQSQLRTIVQEIIWEVLDEGIQEQTAKDVEEEEAGRAAETRAQGIVAASETEGGAVDDAAASATEGKILEDSGEEEGWDDWKNEHEDDNHIEEMEHHLRALKGDRDYERKGAEYDHDKYEDEGDDDRRDEDLQATKGHFSNTMRDPETETHVDYGEGELEEGFLDEKFQDLPRWCQHQQQAIPRIPNPHKGTRHDSGASHISDPKAMAKYMEVCGKYHRMSKRTDLRQEGIKKNSESEKFIPESFFPKGRDIRQKARNELNEALMKRWTKIIK